MKKLLTLLLALVLVFSLVACGNKANETTAETTVETTVETTIESSTETAGETTTETSVETTAETKAETEAEKEVTFLSLALNDSQVVANNGENQGLFKLEAKNESSLKQGFKYEFNFDPSNLAEGGEVQTISVENASILGKQVGFPVNSNVAEKILKEVENVVVLDTRSKEDFAKGHVKDALNVPAEVAEQLGAEGVTLESLGLEKITKESVVLIFGDSAANKALAQKFYGLLSNNVLLDAGSLEEFKGELVTE